MIDIDERGLTTHVGDLLERLAAGFSGLNVTHPCKQAVVPHVDDLSADAAALQAVNTVVFEDGGATGHNTDTTGFAESFARGLPGAALAERRPARGRWRGHRGRRTRRCGSASSG